jgi:FKBP-type peptidyl-prolyl cis-trans isomerase FkpA
MTRLCSSLLLLSLVLLPGCAEPEPESTMPLTADDLREAAGGLHGGSAPGSGSAAGSGSATVGVSEPGLVDADAPEAFQETASGLRYRIRRNSDGAKPTADQSVTVNYRGWLDDGTEFDSSYKRSEPTSFPLGGVIKGWTEGLQLIGVGGMLELEIPSELGYGANGSGGSVPPNATLHFIVELLSIQ